MDKVRLGRALGYGTRHAARTLAAVAEAAAAPDPRGTPPQNEAQNEAQSEARQPNPGPTSAGETAPVDTARIRASRPRPTAAQVRGASRSVLGPLATFSGALWLRVTGLFFGLIALAMANGAWRLRATDPGHHFWLFTAFGLLFGYFAVSGFVRASLRERRATHPAAR